MKLIKSNSKEATIEIDGISKVFTLDEKIGNTFKTTSDDEKPYSFKKRVTIKGDAKSILSRERVMLNILQRLCGIATHTKQYVSLATPFNIKILDTRKTTPGMRLFEKYAVKSGSKLFSDLYLD